MRSAEKVHVSHYDAELKSLPQSYERALRADVAALKQAIAAAGDSSIIAAGSGASFTVASVLCSLHETFTGRVSRPCTPLEMVCNPTLAASSPVFLISAEGKNPDILEALDRSRRNSARPVHVLTNREESPLTAKANGFRNIGLHIFETSSKDGYLGTNSLLMNSVLVARTYRELDSASVGFPDTLAQVTLNESSVEDWISSSNSFLRQTTKRQTLIVVFSPLLKPIAIDLESKLSETAFLNCQLTDIRSFAHGRHLWLGERPNDCAILALVDRPLASLWRQMRSQFPSDCLVQTMDFRGSAPDDLIAGLVAIMRLVGVIGTELGKDPGRPSVPTFARSIHYMELADCVPATSTDIDDGQRSKHEVLGARWPFARNTAWMQRASSDFRQKLQNTPFRCVVFDYDGVLCSSHQRSAPPASEIVDHFVKLVEAGVIIGIASGRGGSVQEQLRQFIPERNWPNIFVGLYNAGFVGGLGDDPPKGETSEYLSHVTRIVNNLKSKGVPIVEVKTTHPYQVSVRFRDGSHTDKTWFVIADALRNAGLDLLRVVRSKHSVDVLGVNVGKSHLVATIVERTGADPYEVLTIGDQGAWPGNDASLLDHRFSLSVDEPSRRLDRGWKLAPSFTRDVDATLWYLSCVQLLGGGKFKLKFS